MNTLEAIIALLAAALVAPLVGGRWNVPAAAWLLPALLLAGTDRLGPAQAWLVALAVLSLGGLLSLADQVPLPLPTYVGYVVVTSAINALAYLAGHAGLAATGGFAGTLAFPAAVLAIEAVSATASPFGHWGSLAYTQYGNLPLTQVAAVAGNPAITLLVCWFGSSLAWAWVHGFAPDRVRTALLVYGCVLAAVLLAGGVRLARSRHAGQTVRIASLTEPELPGVPPVGEIIGHLMRDGDLDEESLAELRRASRALLAEVLRDTVTQARAGARIVFWAECAGLVPADDEADLVRRAGEVAREHGCYLAAALAVVHRAGPRHLENKVVLLAPTGEVAFEYRKARPVPGGEAAHSLPGGGAMHWLDTPYGRIGVLICFDVDIPRLARQISAARLDILLVPASDWPAIDPTHSQMAALAGIEHGASVVRQARGGLSLATDAYGRVLAAYEHPHGHRADEHPAAGTAPAHEQPATGGAAPAMIADVPVTGARTLRRLFSGLRATAHPATAGSAATASAISSVENS